MKFLMDYLSNAKGYEPQDSAEQLRDFYVQSVENAILAEELWEEATAPKESADYESFCQLLEEYGLYVQCYWESVRHGEKKPEMKMEIRVYNDSDHRVACIKVSNMPKIES